MPLTPEEEEALILEVTGGKPPPASDIGAVGRPPEPKRPDVAGAAMGARAATSERLSLADPGGATRRAEDIVDELLAPPPKVPAKPTLAQQAAKSYSPSVVQRDDRPDAEGSGFIERTGEYVKQRGLTGIAADIVQPGFSVARDYGYQAGKGIAERVSGRDPTAPIIGEGAKTENAAFYLMRTLFTTAGAIIVEGAERLPAHNLSGAVEAARSAPDNMSAVTGFLEAFYGSPSTAGQQVLGFDPGADQRIRRTDEGLGRDYLQGVLERVERGSGLEEDFSRAASARLGEEYAPAGWIVGLGADMLINWEKGLVSAPQALARTAASAKRLSDITPSGMGSAAKYLEAAVKGHEISYTREIAGRIADDLEAGRRSLDDLPAEWRLRLNEAALINRGVSAREALLEELATATPPPASREPPASRTPVRRIYDSSPVPPSIRSRAAELRALSQLP